MGNTVQDETVSTSSMPSPMPLNFLKFGEKANITKVSAKAELRHRLETLGFVEGALVKVLSESGGDYIIEVKGSQVALNHQVALHIMVNA